jgi:transaldolase
MSTDSPATKKIRTENSLDQLKDLTTVVADTGEFSTIKQFSPKDATTNPSLILKAALVAEYQPLIDNAIKYVKSHGGDLSEDDRLALALDKVAVNFGAEISKLVPGYVSTEVDARLSFDTDATVMRARRIIDMYKEVGVDKSRILIKIASTYEGIRAGEILEAEGITCNLTLLFSIVQAVACAEANITLISPFVGRILDWWKAKCPTMVYTAENDPGVLSVKNIYHYFKKYGHKTVVMGASFRNTGEIRALAGCDKLTIAPSLLDELSKSSEPIEHVLKADDSAKAYSGDRIDVSEAAFRYALNDDAMATEKLAEGIRGFATDIIKLENILRAKL